MEKFILLMDITLCIHMKSVLSDTKAKIQKIKNPKKNLKSEVL